MKRLFSLLLCVTLVLISVCHAWAVDAKASETLPSLGDKATDIDIEALEKAGYKIVDDTDATITYTWPYDIDGARTNSDTALNGTLTSQIGQVCGTLTYFFSGTYLAVLFAEHYYAADIIVNIDGVSYTAENPQNSEAPKGDVEGGASRVVFIKDDLPDGDHTVTISHQAGHNSGEDNIKGDGNAYYDNVALFDAFIIEDESFIPTVTLPDHGDAASDIDIEALEKAGYKIVDDTDASIGYTWPYNLEHASFNSDTAIGGTLTSQLGQVSGTFTYFFSGTYLAVLFAEHHYAADIIVNIDGVSYTAENPYYSEAPKGDAEGGISRVVFIKDDLSEGDHQVIISHKPGYNSGDENIKGDGNKYYDNVAVFDAFIIKESESESADGLTVGKNAVLYDEATLDALNLKIIDDTDPNIIYTWPYDLDTAKITHGTALGHTAHWNIGQVGASITMIFEGSVLGVAFCETYFASKVIIDVDGEVVGEFIPHTDVRTTNLEIAHASKVFFVKTDLAPGVHILTLTHETAYESGEDNLKADGNKYYDNNAYFDCIFVQKTPDDPSDNPPIIEDTTAEDTTVADTTVADTTVADTTVEDTTVEDTTVADTTAEDTTVEDTTVAPVETTVAPMDDTTAAPVSETTATPETTTEVEPANGCKSSIGLGCSAVAVATAAGALLTKKRRHDDE